MSSQLFFRDKRNVFLYSILARSLKRVSDKLSLRCTRESQSACQVSLARGSRVNDGDELPLYGRFESYPTS